MKTHRQRGCMSQMVTERTIKIWLMWWPTTTTVKVAAQLWTWLIYHYLWLVVGDLLEFWDPGVYFSQTYRRKPGWLFKGMLVPLVADLLTARQVIGLPGSLTAHSFCTFCDLDHDDIDVLDPTEWPAKDVDHIRRISKLWKNADSEQHQQQIFEAWGLRWSALLDLPWIRCVIL